MKQYITFICSLFLAATTFAQSPYISKVYEYMPAPGQFVHLMPEFDPDGVGWQDLPETTCRRLMTSAANEYLVNDQQYLVSLGGWGGYIIFGFDHMVENNPSELDFQILGNAFYSNTNPNPDAPKEGGSSEPGIVMVAYDANKNGLPDDEWYELAGSEYDNPATRHHYSLTYYRPSVDHQPTPDNSYPYLIDTTYIRWRDSDGNTGFMPQVSFHKQPYYPIWLSADSITFYGSRLADNYVDESGTGSYYVQYCYPWGYADNQPNTNPRSKFNISWAVTDDGTHVQLPGIHFVKVYTAVHQSCGWLGETSTEIMGAKDLHLTQEAEIDNFNDVYNGLQTISPSTADRLLILNNPVKDNLIVVAQERTKALIIGLRGDIITELDIKSGNNILPLAQLPGGMYVLLTSSSAYKLIKQ